MLPWCELALANESGQIVDALALLNGRGMLSINSQPAVDGAPSHDPDVGWGGAGGYVYQKAYEARTALRQTRARPAPGPPARAELSRPPSHTPCSTPPLALQLH